MVAPTTGSYRVYLQLAHECTSVHGLHDDEFRDFHGKAAANCFGRTTGTGTEAEATAFEAIAAAADTAGQDPSAIARGDQGIRGAAVAHCRIQWAAGV